MMRITSQDFALALAFAVAPPLVAAGETDCLLKGTVYHEEQAGQDATRVKINSLSRYDEASRCSMRKGQKLEFKLPHDSRVQTAPSGSAVQYRYRTDENGHRSAELISVGT